MAASRRRCWNYGGDSVTDGARSAIDLLADRGQVQERLPIWTDWGVRDESVLVHSLGCSFLTLMGDRLGYVAVSEVPAPRQGSHAHISEDVRSDSVWFDRETSSVELIAEFERYSGKQKDLAPKVESLLLAHHRWGKPGTVLILAYWTIGLVSLPDHAALRQIVSGGYQTGLRERVSGDSSARIEFLQYVLQEDQDGLLRLSDIRRRGTS